MRRRITPLSVLAIYMAARSGLARAQVTSGSQDVQIYAGELFGDRRTDPRLAGGIPRLNDSATFGGRYTVLGLVTDHGQGLNTAETTQSVGYQF